MKLDSYFRIKRLNRKLDWKNLKYIVLELIGLNAVKLNTPGRIYLVFNVNKLRLAAIDPLPS